MKIISPIASAISGSVAGLTGSHNRGGLYLRARAVPTNPATSFQVAVRNAITTLTSRWSDTLTQGQRDAWDVYAFNVPVTDTLGQSRNLSGQQHYIRSNAPRIQAGLDRVDDAPVVFNLGDFTTPTLQINSPAEGAMEIGFDADDAWVDETDAAMLVYASRPQSAGRSFFKGPYRYASKIEGDDTTAPTSPAQMNLPFAIEADSRGFIQCRVTRADGRLSGVSRVTAIAD